MGLSKRANEQDDKQSHSMNNADQMAKNNKKVNNKRNQESEHLPMRKERVGRTSLSYKSVEEAKGRLSPKSYANLKSKAEARREYQRQHQAIVREKREYRLANGKATTQDIRMIRLRKVREQEKRREKQKKREEKDTRIQKNKEEISKIRQDYKQTKDINSANQAALSQIPMAFKPHVKFNEKRQQSSPIKKQS